MFSSRRAIDEISLDRQKLNNHRRSPVRQPASAGFPAGLLDRPFEGRFTPRPGQVSALQRASLRGALANRCVFSPAVCRRLCRGLRDRSFKGRFRTRPELASALQRASFRGFSQPRYKFSFNHLQMAWLRFPRQPLRRPLTFHENTF